ncbi:opsin-3-like [Condylostylus longicornis]|uniref:opsin-3-like n=1 Tax=Condylostylus longicornis TaxID=2530218 RepID=UPI00244E4802|nr:opsin-3-like [Condylostylus longicornis]XP_055379316.1 opsin-3-like [Condylostylus longicornis]
MANIFGNATHHNEIGPITFEKLVSTEQHKLLGWNFPVEELHLVHPHWRGYAAPPFFYHLFMFIVYFFMMTISSLGNGLVVFIFSTSKNLRTPSNLFILNLAIFDLAMMLEMPMFLVNSAVEYIVGFESACNIYAALGSISGQGAAITNAMIAFDRYRTISSPIDGRLNYVQATFLVIFTWFYATPFTIFPYVHIWNRYIPEGYLTTCSFDYLTEDSETRVFTMTLFIWAYAIPMSIIIICYFKLFMKVKDHEAMLKEQARKMNVKSLSANQVKDTNVELRIAKAAVSIVILFVCSWTPYAWVAITGAFGDRTLLTPSVSMLPAVAAKIVSCIDPWVYAVAHPKYRAELEKRLPWLGIREKELTAPSKDSQSTKSADAESVVQSEVA